MKSVRTRISLGVASMTLAHQGGWMETSITTSQNREGTQMINSSSIITFPMGVCSSLLRIKLYQELPLDRPQITLKSSILTPCMSLLKQARDEAGDKEINPFLYLRNKDLNSIDCRTKTLNLSPSESLGDASVWLTITQGSGSKTVRKVSSSPVLITCNLSLPRQRPN